MPDKNRKKPKAQAKPNDAAPAAKKASGKKSKQSSEVKRFKAQLAAAEAALLVKRTSDMLNDEEEQEQEVRAKKKTKTTQQDVPDSSDEDIPSLEKTILRRCAERRILNTTDKSEDATKFTAEEYTSRYDYHLATLEKLQKRSPTWFAEFQRNLYSVIVNSTTFNHLKAIVNQQEDSDNEDIDFSALEASIVKAAPQPTMSTQ
ncbi:hypothetical protein C8R44DRAFT_893685 [Mycena epipterygia]|nr:hypothetical protein C8R44DRAFT_893685 [Mycena epipterygia]